MNTIIKVHTVVETVEDETVNKTFLSVSSGDAETLAQVEISDGASDEEIDAAINGALSEVIEQHNETALKIARRLGVVLGKLI